MDEHERPMHCTAMLSAVQKARVMVGVFMDESGECEQILRAVFNNGTDEGRRMIWRMHQFVYTDARAVSALQRMSVLERVVYENNRRALHLRELKENNAEACLLREMERSGGDRYVVQGQVLEVPPWAVREVCETYKCARPATPEDVVWEERSRRAEEERRAKEEEERKARQARIWAAYVPEDWTMTRSLSVWDDEPLCVTVREMRHILDEDRVEETGYPRSRREMVQELLWVFQSPLYDGETFAGRQARYRRSKDMGRYGQGFSRVLVADMVRTKKEGLPARIMQKGAKPY